MAGWKEREMDNESWIEWEKNVNRNCGEWAKIINDLEKNYRQGFQEYSLKERGMDRFHKPSCQN